MEEGKTTSSSFSREHKLELCEWLEIGHQRLNSLIEVADLDDIVRLVTFTGKDDVRSSLLRKVDMKSVMPDMSKFQGGCVADGGLPGFDLEVDPRVSNYGLNKEIVHIDKAITTESCDQIKEYYFLQGHAVPNHLTCWDEKFASEMFVIINGALGAKQCSGLTSTDWWQHNRENDLMRFHGSHPPHVSPVSESWKPVGITPLVRFTNLKHGEKRYAHYDAGYIYDNPCYRTLMSGILYLTSNLSGATRFTKDDQSKMNVWNRNHVDSTRKTKDMDVQSIFYPVKGSILLYDHRLLHDVQPLAKDEDDRTAIRFDIVYEANL